MWDDIGKTLSVVGLCFVALMTVIITIGKHAEWVTKSAAIEQLRIDSKKVDSKMAEDVAGQVTALNQEIAENRRWRKTVWGIFIPSGWDTIHFIELPPVSK